MVRKLISYLFLGFVAGLLALVISFVAKWIQPYCREGWLRWAYQLLWVLLPVSLGFLGVVFLSYFSHPGRISHREFRKYFYGMTWVLFLLLVGLTYLGVSGVHWVLALATLLLVAVFDLQGRGEGGNQDRGK